MSERYVTWTLTGQKMGRPMMIRPEDWREWRGAIIAPVPLDLEPVYTAHVHHRPPHVPHPPVNTPEPSGLAWCVLCVLATFRRRRDRRIKKAR